MSSAASPTGALPSASADPALSGHGSAYLLGIGGVGMSAAAELLRARGLTVRGSDRVLGPAVAHLAGRGIEVDVGDEAVLTHIPAGVDLVVHSAAIPAEHPQLRAAAARGIETWKFADLVGALMADRLAVSVAGSHGKTTTTSLLASTLVHAGRDPAYLVGGRLLASGTGAGLGRGEHFVAESCEFDRSFHRHRPQIAVITNVDEDHLDYYRDLAEIQEAFRVFAARLPEDGLLLVNEAYAPLFRGDPRIRARIETFGFGADADWAAGPGQADGPGHRTDFALRRAGRGGESQAVGRLQVPLLGRHNVLNALAAAAAAMAAGLSFEETAAGLAAFGGVGRRLEPVADSRGLLLFDDYGHHPAEIRAVVRALGEKYPGRRLVVIFQPHQASRTRCLLKDFAAALALAGEVWLPPIYFARDSEEERRRVTSDDLAAHVRNEGGSARTFGDLAAVVEHALEEARPGDVIVTMGAGNVDEVAHGLARRLS